MKMNNEVICRREMIKALENKLLVEENDAAKGADLVLNLFGFEDRIIDNILEPQDRQLFYALENAGFLKSEMEETTLYDSRGWRVHYWVLQKNAIKSASLNAKAKKSNKLYSIYDKIPDEWFFRNM
jgi:hypothetical protein